MAQIPQRESNAKSETAKGKDTGFIIEDVVEEMPGATEVNSVVNPFQEAVNTLAKDSRGHDGNAVPVVVPADDEDWARTQIRRAAANVNKGARTKVVPIKEGEHKGKVRIYFTVGAKTKRAKSQD